MLVTGRISRSSDSAKFRVCPTFDENSVKIQHTSVLVHPHEPVALLHYAAHRTDPADVGGTAVGPKRMTCGNCYDRNETMDDGSAFG